MGNLLFPPFFADPFSQRKRGVILGRWNTIRFRLSLLVISPDEYPFTSDLPDPVLPPLKFPEILFPNPVNANPSILSFYIRTIVPRITRRATIALAAFKRAHGITGDEEFEDDGNYGSAATIDVEVLQSISKRVHYGSWNRGRT